MKCNINCGGLKADDVDVTISTIFLTRKTKQVIDKVIPAVKVGEEIIEEERTEYKGEEYWNLRYKPEIKKGGNVIELPSLHFVNCEWDNETHPVEFAEADFKAREDITLL